MSARDRIRFGVKKAARAAFGVFGPAVVGRAERSQLRVLTYHRFGEVPNDPFCLPSRAFESQVRWIAESGKAVSLDQVCSWLSEGYELPDGALLITIDDGHSSTWTHARPILEAHGVPAVAYVTSELVGKGDLDGRMPESYMDWDQVSRLAESGIALGSHAANHRSVGCLPSDQAFAEIDGSRRQLETRTGLPVRSFAYPFGTRIDCTPETARLAREAGYELAFTSQHGSIRRDLDRFLLPRVKIEAGEGDWHFRRTCRGAMDAWRTVDGLMWRLQQNRSETLAESESPSVPKV
jgi:peptidoglycan/xylan/chitin deacetylase (PgdA/CDA1 family)